MGRPWNKGLTKDTDQRIAAYASKCCWNKDLTKESDTRVASIARKLTGKKRSPETKLKQSKSHLAYYDVHKHIWLGRPMPLEIRQKISATTKGQPRYENRGHHLSPEHKAKIGAKSKEMWQNPEYRYKITQSIKRSQDEHTKAIIRANRMKPNKCEIKLEQLLQAILPNQYKYIGDGKLTIDGLCPDFINANGQKKLIELFGTYWHSIFDVAKRTERYRQYGFKTLIIWEDELDSPNLKAKILAFNKSRK